MAKSNREMKKCKNSTLKLFYWALYTVYTLCILRCILIGVRKTRKPKEL